MPSLTLTDYGQHICLIGSTGSGKSELERELLLHYDSYFVIDTQDGMSVPGTVVKTPGNLPLELFLHKRIRYVPKRDYRSRDHWNYMFQCLDSTSTKKRPKPRIISIDEIYHLGYGVAFPTALPTMMSTARQKKLSMWIATQRPRMIPGAVLTECKFLYVFYLSKADDIDFISRFARRDRLEFRRLLENQQDDYSFIRIDVPKGTYELYPKIQLTRRSK